MSQRAYPTRELIRAIAIVTVAIVVVWALYVARETLLLIYISSLLAIGLSPLVALIERQRLLPIGPRRFPRWLAIFLLYLVILGVVAAIGLIVVPQLVQQAVDLWARLPVLLPAAQEFLTSRGLISRPLTLRDAMSASPDTPRDAISTIVATAYSVIGGLVGLLTILVLTFYLLLEAGSIFKTFVSLFSEADRPRVADASRRVSRKLSAWLAGHLILAATMGTLSAIGLFLVGVPYFYVVAVVAAAGELVPILGPVVAGVSAVAIASTVSYKLALAALVYVTVLHQIEANVLVPKVLGRQVGLSPVAVIVSLLIGAGLRGIPGAILAPPTTAILKVVLEELTRRRVSAVSDTRNDEG